MSYHRMDPLHFLYPILTELLRAGELHQWMIEELHFNRTFVLRVVLPSGRDQNWALTHDELEMGGNSIDTLRMWSDRVRADLEGMLGRDLTPPDVPRSQYETHAIFNPRRFYEQEFRENFDPFSRKSRYDERAERKAREAFRRVAGKKAFDTLNANRPLPLTGSNGTRYTLHKRATYCVERPDTNQQFCAVVPGVPLWDHLLGIKLMIERDEPRFLVTANVSRGIHALFE